MIIKSAKTVFNGRHIKVVEAECEHNGKSHAWEYVTRGGNPVGDAVMAVPIKRCEDGCAVILIKQFRPPLNDYIYEFPSGLIDDGETPEQAAVRELAEETGYASKVADMVDATSPILYNSPGLTDESIVMVVLDIDINATPTQALGPTEDIKVIELPTNGITDFIHQPGVKFGAKCFLMLSLLENL